MSDNWRKEYQEIESDPRNRFLLDLIKNKHNGAIPDLLKEYLTKRSTWSDILVIQRKKWIKQLIEVSESISRNTYPESDLGIFWIRLGGITELQKAYRIDFFNEKNAPVYNMIKQHFARLEGELTRSEWAVVDHERQAQCHPSPTGHLFNLERKKGGGFSAKREYKHFGTLIDMEEFESLLKAEYSCVSHPSQIAKRIARKIRSTIEAIDKLMERNEFEY